jgi:hypothetical protein
MKSEILIQPLAGRSPKAGTNMASAYDVLCELYEAEEGPVAQSTVARRIATEYPAVANPNALASDLVRQGLAERVDE